MNIKDRKIEGQNSRDPSAILLNEYNEPSGAEKNIEVGRALLPLGNGASGFTTDATTKRVLPRTGKNLAIYNNSAAVHAVTVGDETMVAQAAGVVQTAGGPTAPFVGVPCTPNEWTYLAAAQWKFVQTDNAALMVFLIDDPTYIVTQPQNNAST